MKASSEQLSLFEVGEEPKQRLAPEPPGRHNREVRPHDPDLPGLDKPGRLAAPALRVEGERARIANEPARRRQDASKRDDELRRSGIERHYRTREVAELLSVHEETVLRLAQCGRLRSIRVGSERRYAESAIIAFLDRNVDQGAVRGRPAQRLRA